MAGLEGHGSLSLVSQCTIDVMRKCFQYGEVPAPPNSGVEGGWGDVRLTNGHGSPFIKGGG